LLSFTTSDNEIASARKVQQGKISRDFQNVLHRFQQIEKMAAEKSREYVVKAKAISEALKHGEEQSDDEEESFLSYERR
jgi:syntaxin 7